MTHPPDLNSLFEQHKHLFTTPTRMIINGVLSLLCRMAANMLWLFPSDLTKQDWIDIADQLIGGPVSQERLAEIDRKLSNITKGPNP